MLDSKNNSEILLLIILSVYSRRLNQSNYLSSCSHGLTLMFFEDDKHKNKDYLWPTQEVTNYEPFFYFA